MTIGERSYFCMSGTKLLLTTNMWNNAEIVKVTGYSITMLKPCLYDLAHYTKNSLTPDPLWCFDLESIRAIDDLT